jgi:hypothetical protein
VTVERPEEEVSLDTENWAFVGARAGRVVVSRPPAVGAMGYVVGEMGPADALVLAAWLVVVAEGVDPDLPSFGAVLAEVRRS